MAKPPILTPQADDFPRWYQDVVAKATIVQPESTDLEKSALRQQEVFLDLGKEHRNWPFLLTVLQEAAPGSKVVLTLAMWIGRLEVITVLVILRPEAWRSGRWSVPAAPANA